MALIDATGIFSFGVRIENVEVLKQTLVDPIIPEGIS